MIRLIKTTNNEILVVGTYGAFDPASGKIVECQHVIGALYSNHYRSDDGIPSDNVGIRTGYAPMNETDIAALGEEIFRTESLPERVEPF